MGVNGARGCLTSSPQPARAVYSAATLQPGLEAAGDCKAGPVSSSWGQRGLTHTDSPQRGLTLGGLCAPAREVCEVGIPQLPQHPSR